jgi:hypothetical protein
MMKAKDIGEKIQSGFDWICDALEPIENRWLVFMVSVFAILITKAAGAQGLSNLIALIYIMFWITRNQSRNE